MVRLPSASEELLVSNDEDKINKNSINRQPTSKRMRVLQAPHDVTLLQSENDCDGLGGNRAKKAKLETRLVECDSSSRPSFDPEVLSNPLTEANFQCPNFRAGFQQELNNSEVKETEFPKKMSELERNVENEVEMEEVDSLDTCLCQCGTLNPAGVDQCWFCEAAILGQEEQKPEKCNAESELDALSSDSGCEGDVLKAATSNIVSPSASTGTEATCSTYGATTFSNISNEVREDWDCQCGWMNWPYDLSCGVCFAPKPSDEPKVAVSSNFRALSVSAAAITATTASYSATARTYSNLASTVSIATSSSETCTSKIDDKKCPSFSSFSGSNCGISKAGNGEEPLRGSMPALQRHNLIHGQMSIDKKVDDVSEKFRVLSFSRTMIDSKSAFSFGSASSSSPTSKAEVPVLKSISESDYGGRFWVCPKCSLFNYAIDLFCAACSMFKPDGIDGTISPVKIAEPKFVFKSTFPAKPPLNTSVLTSGDALSFTDAHPSDDEPPATEMKPMDSNSIAPWKFEAQQAKVDATKSAKPAPKFDLSPATPELSSPVFVQPQEAVKPNVTLEPTTWNLAPSSKVAGGSTQGYVAPSSTGTDVMGDSDIPLCENVQKRHMHERNSPRKKIRKIF